MPRTWSTRDRRDDGDGCAAAVLAAAFVLTIFTMLVVFAWLQ